MKREKATAALLRRLALGLPGAEEREHMGSASFRVAGKIFTQLTSDESAALVKLSPAQQAELVEADPERFWTPTHWAKFGWTYVRLAGTDADELHGLVQGSWQRIAPKALAAKR